MSEPNYCNLRGVVNDLITRSAKFGSFKASKAALDNKYGTPHRKSPGAFADHYSYYNKNFEEVAGINYYREADANRDLVYNGVKEITTKTLNYKTNPNGDKFVRMYGYDEKSDCCYSIMDTNNNGYVDNGDTIRLSHTEYSPEGARKDYSLEKTITEFLGN